MKLNRILIFLSVLILCVFTANAVPIVNNTAYYSFDTPTSIFRDLTDNGFNASNVGSTNVSGIIGSAREFVDASSQRVSTGITVTNWNQISNSFWFRATTVPTTTDNLWGTSNAGGRDLECTLLASQKLRCQIATSGADVLVSSVSNIAVDTWYHVAYAWNRKTNFSLWINGTLEATTTSNDLTEFYSNPLYIGGANGGSFSDSIIDEWSLWNRTLTGTDISNLYNGGIGLQFNYSVPPPSSVTTTIQAFYNTTNISVQINSTSIINLSFSLDGAAEVSVWTNQNNGSVNITSLSEGNHSIVWVGADANLSQNFTIDLTIPSLNVTAFSTTNSYVFNFSNAINVSDLNLDTCIVNVVGTTTPCTNQTFQFVTNGNHSFNVTATDLAGNINQSLNNIAFVNPLQNFTFINRTGGIITNFTFGGTLEPGSQARILTFGAGLVFGNNNLTFAKLGFQTTVISFNINSTSHLNLTNSINDSQINIRFFDRETLSLIPGITTVTLVGPPGVGFNGTTINGLFNISNINFVAGTYQIIGENANYLTESVFFTFTGQEVLQKDLFLLNSSSSDAGTVTIQLTANTGQFVQGAICSALEWRPAESAFVSVAEGNTNTEGSTILNIEIGTKLYRFQCSKSGLSVTSPQQIIQSTGSLIPLVLNVDAPAPVLLLGNFISSLRNITLNVTHQQIIYNFTSVDGLVTQACLNQYQQNGNFRSLLSQSCVSASTGQIQAVININRSFTQTMVATATQSGVEQEVDTLTFSGNLSFEAALNTYGFSAFIPLLLMILSITIGFMIIPSNMQVTTSLSLIAIWLLRYIVPSIVSSSSAIFMSVVLLLIIWGSKR